MFDKLQYLFLLPPKFSKGIFQIKKKHLVLLYIVLVGFGATRIKINALSGSGSEKRNRSGSRSGKMQWIRIFGFLVLGLRLLLALLGIHYCFAIKNLTKLINKRMILVMIVWFCYPLSPNEKLLKCEAIFIVTVFEVKKLNDYPKL